MARYILADDAIRELEGEFPAADFVKIIRCISRTQTANVVDKERYDRLRDNANILSDALSEYQSDDVVKVVRCKDCVHHKNAPKTTDVWCDRLEGLLPNDWFCADGERRKNDE